MTYLNCPSCGLAIQLRHASLAVRHCPRCIAKRRTAIAMFVSPMTLRQLTDEPGEDGEELAAIDAGER